MLKPLPTESWFRPLFVSVSISMCLGLAGAAAQPVLESLPATKNGEPGKIAPVAIPTYALKDCLRIAFERQPKLNAVRASLRSAEAAERGIEDTRLIGCLLIPDIKFRKQQAAQGVMASQAELHQAEQEVTQAVVWTYYTVIYAREQQKIVKELVDLIQTYRDQVDKIVNSKDAANRDINQNTLNTLDVALSQAKRKELTASSGIDRATAALHEAMGLTEKEEFKVAPDVLPDINADLKLQMLIDLALERRGEVILAGIASEVSRLEVLAQWSIKLRLRTNTYTLTADIHHILIPGGSKDTDYRPDPIAPEMPPHLVGNKGNRTARVQALADRAAEVSQKTRNLVVLETKSSFSEWEKWTKTGTLAKSESKSAKDLYSRLRKVADDEGFKQVTIENVIRAHAAYTEATAAFNEARFQQIVSLAALERITGGGIRVNYPGR